MFHVLSRLRGNALGRVQPHVAKDRKGVLT